MPSPLPTLGADSVTRILCAAMYDDEPAARAIHRELCVDELRPVTPSHGMDLLALGRHARQARRLHEMRLVTQTLCGGLMVVGIVLVLWSPIARSRQLFVAGLGLVVLGIACAWLLDGALVVSRRRRAVRILTSRTDPRGSAPQLPRPREQALEEAGAEDANVVIHEAGTERAPFIDAGFMVQRPVWPAIDVSRPGRGRQRQPFTTNELIDYLAERFVRAGLERVSVREVLYVRGDVVQRIRELRAAPERPPTTVVPEALLRLAAREARDGTRNYLRVQVLGEGGRLVVTMNVRAAIRGPHLTFDVVAHVLPPLHDRYQAVRRVHPSAVVEVIRPFIKSPRDVARDLAKAPSALVRARVTTAVLERRIRQSRRVVRSDRLAYDFGRPFSVRVGVSDPSEMTDADTSDAVQWLQLLSRTLLDATEVFLEQHGISTSDLRRNRESIVNNYTIGTVRESAIGDNARTYNSRTDAVGE